MKASLLALDNVSLKQRNICVQVSDEWINHGKFCLVSNVFYTAQTPYKTINKRRVTRLMTCYYLDLANSLGC